MYLVTPKVKVKITDYEYDAQELETLVNILQEVFGTNDVDVTVTISGHNTRRGDDQDRHGFKRMLEAVKTARAPEDKVEDISVRTSKEYKNAKEAVDRIRRRDDELMAV